MNRLQPTGKLLATLPTTIEAEHGKAFFKEKVVNKTRVKDMAQLLSALCILYILL